MGPASDSASAASLPPTPTRPGCSGRNTAPIAFANWQLRFDREVRQIVAQKLTGVDFDALSGSVAARDGHGVPFVGDLGEGNAHARSLQLGSVFSSRPGRRC